MKDLLAYMHPVVQVLVLLLAVPFRSPHFFFGTLALLLFVAGGYTGWRLKQGTERYADVRDIHGFLVYFALFIALAVAIMGFILLP